MLTLIKRDQPWTARADGHVLHESMMREFKRKGAIVAALSEVQWEGYFGAGKPNEFKIDGVHVVLDKAIPDDEVDFFNEENKFMGRIVGLYVEPEVEDDKS